MTIELIYVHQVDRGTTCAYQADSMYLDLEICYQLPSDAVLFLDELMNNKMQTSLIRVASRDAISFEISLGVKWNPHVCVSDDLSLC